MSEIIQVGIDLGTTNTLVSVMNKGKMKCLKFGRSEMLPSVLYVNEDGSIEVGEKAQAKGVIDPNNRIKSSKTWMGDFYKTWKFDGLEVTPTLAATEILKTVKANVMKRLKVEEGTTIEAVITVPAYFTSNQIDETRKAGQAAGFKVTRITTEPMAAAIAYGANLATDDKLFVIDLGGGTFDISVLQVNYENNVYDNLAVDGDKKLGGDDFDETIFKYFNQIIQEDLEIDLSSLGTSGLEYGQYYSMQGRLLQAAERAKVELSESDEAEVLVPNLFTYEGEEYNFETRLSRAKFDSLCAPLYKRINQTITDMIKRENIDIKGIGRVILVGGSCYIPAIKENVEKIFNQKVYTDMDLSTLVVTGACILANSQTGVEKVQVNDIISHSLGIEVVGENGQELSRILLKNRKYPATEAEIFTTTFDYQEVVTINVYEGEDEKDLTKNEFYGSFTLEGIEKAKKGVPQIEVTFNFDESRILEVTAKDLTTSACKKVTMKKGEKIISGEQSPIDFMLLIDASGSMSIGGRMDEAKKACNKLIEEMIDLSVHRLGLVDFTSRAELICGLTQDENKLLDTVAHITTGGSTNMHHAIKIANNELKSSINDKVIIIVTDGRPDNNEEAKAMAKVSKQSGIRVITIGVGNDIDRELMKRLSSVSETNQVEFYQINNMNKLAETFKTIINSLSRQ